MHQLIRNVFATGIVAAISLALPAAAQDVDLASIKPACPKPFKSEPEGGKCVPDQAELDARKTQETCATTVGLAFENDKCVAKGTAPAPNCGTQLAGLAYKNGSCVVDRTIPNSRKGDYEGDFFHIEALSDAHSRITYAPGTYIRVLSQKPLGEDMELTTAAMPSHPFPFFRDTPVPGTTRKIRASDLREVGSTRAGWAYGGLALPFKYYTGDKHFKTNVSVGPYAGWRWGTPGSTVTVAVTAAFGGVTGEVRDENNNITSRPELLAFSMGAGVMWDLSKSQDAKPFKMGIFAGKDRVSSDDVVKFSNNRKWWLSLQVGFDFTDN